MGERRASLSEAVKPPSWLLLPGHLCTGALWDGVRAPLIAAGRDVATADMCSDASADAMARRAIATLSAPAVLVGFSLGGIVAMRMHVLAPDLVAGLVLISSNARAHLPERNAARIEHERRARAGEFGRIVACEMVPGYFATEHAELATLRRSAVEMASELGADVFVKQSEAIRTRPDSRPQLKRIRCPCLIVGGRQDALSPVEWQQELADGIASAELLIIEDCGHFVPLEAQEALAAALRGWSARHGF